MLCITSVIYFFFYLIKKDRLKLKQSKEEKDALFKTTFRFFKYSLLSGLVLGSILVTLFFMLKNSDATSGGSLNFSKFYFNPLQFAAAHFSLIKPTVLFAYAGDSPLPNISASTPAVILVGLFFFNNKIRTKDKVLYFMLLTFFYLSFAYQPFDYVWHGFHFANDIPFRNAFIYIFFFLTIAAFSLNKLKGGINAKGFVCNFILLFVVTLLAYFSEEKFKTYALAVTVIIECLCLLLYFLWNKDNFRKIAKYFLIIITIGDVVISSGVSFNFTIQKDDFMGDYENVTKSVDYIKENDQSDYRIEMSESLYGTEGNMYNLISTSGFSSMASKDFSQLQWKLGMRGNNANQQCYSSYSPVIDLINSTKYVIQKNKSSDRPSSYFYEKYYQSGDTVVWKNKYFVPMGVISSPEYSTTTIPDTNNPFKVQNSIFKAYSTISNVFTEQNVSSIDSSNVTVERKGASYIVTPKDDEKSKSSKMYVEFNININESGPVYAHLSSSFGSDNDTWKSFATPVTVKKNNIKTDFNENVLGGQIYYIGDFEKGDTLTLCFDITDSYDFEHGYINIRGIGTLNLDKFKKGYEIMSKNALNVQTTGNKISINVPEGKNESIINTNIPYNDGWKIKNEKIAQMKIINNNGLISIALPIHQYTNIELKYFPKGLLCGGIISCVSAVLLTASLSVEKRKTQNVLPCKTLEFMV